MTCLKGLKDFRPQLFMARVKEFFNKVGQKKQEGRTVELLHKLTLDKITLNRKVTSGKIVEKRAV